MLSDAQKTASQKAGSSDRVPPALAEGENTFTIGDLAREFGITLRTLRFYEDRGLISPRRSGMTRLYNEKARARLALILKGKHLGFTLTEIRAMLESEESGGELKLTAEQIAEQIAHLEQQKTELDKAIAELRAAQKRIQG
jgi:DNA-binding transcriptional MerR regulator